MNDRSELHDHPEQPREPRFDVFISYAAADKSVAQLLAVEIKNRGIRPWFAEWELRAGTDTDWISAVREAIAESRHWIVLVSPSSDPHQRWQSLEWSAIQREAWRRSGSAIVPIQVDPQAELPPFLRAWHAIPLTPNRDSLADVADQVTALLTSSVQAPERHASDDETAARFRLLSEEIANVHESETGT